MHVIEENLLQMFFFSLSLFRMWCAIEHCDRIACRSVKMEFPFQPHKTKYYEYNNIVCVRYKFLTRLLTAIYQH